MEQSDIKSCSRCAKRAERLPIVTCPPDHRSGAFCCSERCVLLDSHLVGGHLSAV